MPAYRAREYVETAIRSVMAQTMPEWELIVIDDCSGDETPEVVHALSREDDRIRLVRNEENMGVARTRNKGLDMARGRYIALLDSDDVWHPEKLERQIALLEQEQADICYCSYAIIDRKNKRCRGDFLVPDRTDYNASLVQSVISCSTILLRRETAGHYRFPENFYHEDLVLWLQMLADGCRAVGVRQVLAGYRIVDGSRASNKVRTVWNRWRVYRGLGISRVRSAMLLGRYGILALRKYGARVPRAEG
jgi:teichuronic acid biosynthesis glycosyltransferase TuaG